MAHVAFDLDNTLGFFEFTNPLAYFWSQEFLENPEQSRPNAELTISKALKAKLKRAQSNFVTLFLQNPHLHHLVLRPNLHAMILPLLKAKRNRKLKTVILYSNTSVTNSLELAKEIIERMYNAPGLFALSADHWHPLRTADHPKGGIQPYKYVEPKKTITTLQRLFRVAAKHPKNKVIPLKHIAFVDDRNPKHELQEQEAGGLTYIVPTSYYPHANKQEKKELLLLAAAAMDQVGLLKDPEYLNSGFCHRKIPYHFTKLHEIHGFPDLFHYVWGQIQQVRVPKEPWYPDTMTIQGTMTEFLKQIE
jgi:hypothetical protein